jgi:hypothetical protein
MAVTDDGTGTDSVGNVTRLGCQVWNPSTAP